MADSETSAGAASMAPTSAVSGATDIIIPAQVVDRQPWRRRLPILSGAIVVPTGIAIFTIGWLILADRIPAPKVAGPMLVLIGALVLAVFLLVCWYKVLNMDNHCCSCSSDEADSSDKQPEPAKASSQNSVNAHVASQTEGGKRNENQSTLRGAGNSLRVTVAAEVHATRDGADSNLVGNAPEAEVSQSTHDSHQNIANGVAMDWAGLISDKDEMSHF